MDIVLLIECESIKAQRIQALLLQQNIECIIKEPSDVLNPMTSGGMMPLYSVCVNSSDLNMAKEIVTCYNKM